MLIENVHSASRDRSIIGVMNVESIGILGVLGISSDKIGHSSAGIVKNRGLEKVSLVKHRMIS